MSKNIDHAENSISNSTANSSHVRSLPDSITEICLSAFSMAGGSHAALHCSNWSASGETNWSESDFDFLNERYDFAVETNPPGALIAVDALPVEVTITSVADGEVLIVEEPKSHLPVYAVRHPISDFSLELDGLAGHDFYLS